jgi:hypothetical protein
MTKERELLRRLFEELETILSAELYEEIRTLLSTPSDDAEEPVGWLASYPENPDLGNWFCHINMADYEGFKCEPLYLHPLKPAEPAARKPLNGEEILEGFNATGFTNTDYRLRCFIEGVRFAEKHHGIGTE